MYTACQHRILRGRARLGRWPGSLAIQAPASLDREYQPRTQRILMARVVRGYAASHYGNLCTEIDTGVTARLDGRDHRR